MKTLSAEIKNNHELSIGDIVDTNEGVGIILGEQKDDLYYKVFEISLLENTKYVFYRKANEVDKLGNINVLIKLLQEY